MLLTLSLHCALPLGCVRSSAEPLPRCRCAEQVTGGFGPPNTPPVTVKFDRPFVMAIEHYRTGALVFLGTVTQPSAYVAPVCLA